MAKKILYKHVVEEYLNDTGAPLDRTVGEIEYGIPPKTDEVEFTDYDTLLRAIRMNREEGTMLLKDLSVEKSIFRKEYIYSRSRGWIEEGQIHAGRISRKEFKSYKVVFCTIELKPTLEDLIKVIPLEVVMEYLKDNPELSFIKDLKKLLGSK